MGHVRALFLDLDSTLLDSSLFHQSIVRTCQELARVGPGLDADQLHQANGKVFKDYGMKQVDDWTLGRISGVELTGQLWRQTLLACGCDDGGLAQRAGELHGRFMQDTYRPFDDVAQLRAAVERAGIPVALVTNGASDTQREKLETLGLTGWFSALAISGELGVAKPDIGAFTPALEALGVVGKEVWHVGDNLETDVAGANAAGLTAVWLNRDGAERSPDAPQPDVEISSLAELVPYL
ncbi:MAG: HAD-IA family hydrolase [Candidatus Latescibacteria bacterium]|nr:HAD-IA family hydrolase [Candidatus Latescibacterota bacterium]